MKNIDIVFDGPPGPIAGRFVEVENELGASINIGEWVERDDGYWVLRIPDTADALEQATRWISVDEQLPDVGKKWDGKSFVAVFYPYGGGHADAMTTMSLVNLVKYPTASSPKPTHWIPLPVSAGDTLRCTDCGEEITDLRAHCEREDNICLIHDAQTVPDSES